MWFMANDSLVMSHKKVNLVTVFNYRYFKPVLWNWRITVYKNCLIVDFSGNKCILFALYYLICLPSRPNWKVAIRHAAIACHQYVNVGCLNVFHSEGWTILLSDRQICRSLVARGWRGANCDSLLIIIFSKVMLLSKVEPIVDNFIKFSTKKANLS